MHSSFLIFVLPKPFATSIMVLYVAVSFLSVSRIIRKSVREFVRVVNNTCEKYCHYQYQYFGKKYCRYQYQCRCWKVLPIPNEWIASLYCLGNCVFFKIPTLLLYWSIFDGVIWKVKSVTFFGLQCSRDTIYRAEVVVKITGSQRQCADFKITKLQKQNSWHHWQRILFFYHNKDINISRCIVCSVQFLISLICSV